MEAFLGRLAADPGLRADFDALCDFGGRMQGSEGAARAFDWTLARLREIGPAVDEPVAYDGWRCIRSALTLPGGEAVPHIALFGSAPGVVEAEVLDMGRGAPGDAGWAQARGKIVLIRHEYPFAPWTIHRRFKLAAAAEAGVAAALMVLPEPGIGPVSGGANGNPMPCFGVGIEGAARLARAGRARLELEAEAAPATAPTLVLDLPGGGDDGRVVLSAHLDGHPLGESAIDNATGLAAALSLARAVAPELGRAKRGLTVCVFGAEEWALSGSKAWLAGLDARRREAMRFNLNLDSIAGHPRLVALTSGFTALGSFVQGAAARIGAEVAVHLPLMVNSDHANFAAHGIPALRLLAGFDAPEGALRHLLTGADTRALVPPNELKAATLVAGSILWAALTAEPAELDALRARAHA